MILFNDWEITAKGTVARQFDNLSRELVVSGDLPEGWEWSMLVQVGEAMDILALGPMGEGVGVVLTADQLSLSGYYQVQLRGHRGNVVRHTNVLPVYVPESLSGDGQWPTVPSEFFQIETRIRELNSHPPVPGYGGYWMIWNPDTDRYENSQFPLSEGGGAYLETDETLTFKNGVLSVNTADAAEEDNTLPITSAAVHTTVGNIEILLRTI